MTPKEKSEELIKKHKAVFKFTGVILTDSEAAKCALVGVNSSLEVLNTLNKPEYTAFVAKDIYDIGETEYDTHLHGYEMQQYWQEVKEILESK